MFSLFLSLLVAALIYPNFVYGQSGTARVLIYSATRDFRHDSIPTAVQALKNHSASGSGVINVEFENTEDQTQFNDGNLARFDALLFLDNTGEVLDDSGKAAFQKYLNLGGNFIGVHAASDCLRNTTFYGREVGAWFDYHPEIQSGIVDVIGPSNPSTSMLPTQWQRDDEWYNFKSDPRSIGATVILSVNESSYTDTGTRQFDQGTPHPTAWFQEHGAGVESGGTAGRSFYTSLGHLNETWEDETFMAHVLGGISWTLLANTTRAFNSSGQVGAISNTSASSTASSSSVSGTSATVQATESSTASTSSSSNAPVSMKIGLIATAIAIALGLVIQFTSR